MLSKIKSLIPDKGFSLYLVLANILIGAIGVILVLSLDGGKMKIDDSSDTLIYVFGLLAVVVDIASLFIKFKPVNKFLPLLSTGFYGIAAGRAIYLFAYPLADKMTGVNWFDGSFGIYLTFALIFLITTIISVVINFKR